jgi:hypothetical protein
MRTIDERMLGKGKEIERIMKERRARGMERRERKR